MKIYLFIIILTVTISSCRQSSKTEDRVETETLSTDTPSARFQYKANYIADSFDYPVGKPNANGYYNARRFGEKYHLGDDWNAITGGNSDLGDPIYSIANGYVSSAEDHKGGWGKIVRVLHRLPDQSEYESFYAHCDSMLVTEDTWVKKGDQIATIGNADGAYYAHLHLEIRDQWNLDIGGGYGQDTTGYVNPTTFIDNHRKAK